MLGCRNTSVNFGAGSSSQSPNGREFLDYKTSMITDEDPLRGLLFSWDLGFSHKLHVLKKGDGGANTPISRERAAPFLRDHRFLTTR